MQRDWNGEVRTVLFICTHNSARSQMAEGLVNALYSKVLRASSAGTRPTEVHPMTVKAMAELGIDISGQRSKALSGFEGETFDYVVMVCSDAAETCPFFPGGKEQIHQAFDDPVAVEGTEAERMAAFRETRNEINKWIIENLVLR
ncbi:MAG TPA: arsenate reductase ArsC [Methanomassiliicoccales archaeon]|nr:arsenate reductase ArsC [Methanomassiliicoccales archaeon]